MLCYMSDILFPLLLLFGLGSEDYFIREHCDKLLRSPEWKDKIQSWMLQVEWVRSCPERRNRLSWKWREIWKDVATRDCLRHYDQGTCPTVEELYHRPQLLFEFEKRCRDLSQKLTDQSFFDLYINWCGNGEEYAQRIYYYWELCMCIKRKDVQGLEALEGKNHLIRTFKSWCLWKIREGKI